jgi:transketolase
VLFVAHTVKGKGVSFMENDPGWHGKSPKPTEAVEAIREIVGVPKEKWQAHVAGDPAMRTLVDELTALKG